MQTVFHYAKTLQANLWLQSVFPGVKPKRTVVCNQLSYYARQEQEPEQEQERAQEQEQRPDEMQGEVQGWIKSEDALYRITSL